MKIMVIYDSIFGNTEQIAQAIGDAMGEAMGGTLGGQEDVGTFKVNSVKPEQLTGLELLIVGSPTRGFRPTEAIRNFLKGISRDSLKGVKVIAFDTRISMKDVNSPVLRFFVKIFGYAADPIANQLKKKGGTLAAPPEGFFVKGSEGPLKDGELERAAAWVKQIG